MLTLTCFHCTTVFSRPEGLPGALPRYCGPACATSARRERRRLRTQERQRRRAEAYQKVREAAR